jgi:Protein of unknown function (DUF2946)
MGRTSSPSNPDLTSVTPASRRRARLAKGFALGLLALAVQVFAPFASGLAMAGVSVDLDASICSAHSDGAPAPNGAEHKIACALCQVCCHAPDLLGGVAPTVAATAATTFIVRLERRQRLARGPPRDRPKARAPPVSMMT